MSDLILKAITVDNLPALKQMCTDSFETERGIVPDEIMPENGMGSDFERSISEDNIDGWAIYDGDNMGNIYAHQPKTEPCFLCQ